MFGSGINLTRLYHGRIDFLFYLVRDLGYVNKIYRGVTVADADGLAVTIRNVTRSRNSGSRRWSGMRWAARASFCT